MFTGIITQIGVLANVEQLKSGQRLTIQSAFKSNDIDIGASIAHNGVCLTVVAISSPGEENWYQVEAWEEALRLTTLGSWHMGQKINLERALKIGDELGGHLVSGHVDGIAKVTVIKSEGQATRYTLRTPAALAKFIAPKGSVTLNGVSLTVNGVEGVSFDILLIRHSQEVTTWGEIKVGNEVNIEIDQMARYAARLAEYS